MGTPNNRYMQDASYLRLKALTVDYSLPQAWVSKLGLTGLKIYSPAKISSHSPMYVRISTLK